MPNHGDSVLVIIGVVLISIIRFYEQPVWPLARLRKLADSVYKLDGSTTCALLNHLA
jgi:hypothetical protein